MTLKSDGTLNHDELSRSCVLANHLETRLRHSGICTITTLLIDDKRLDASIRGEHGCELIAHLNQFATVDYYCFERDLATYVELMLQCLTSRAKRSQQESIERRFANGHKTLACSVDVTIWHLLRLGILTDTKRILRPLHAADVFCGSDVAVSVLPDYNGDPEKTARRLLRRVRGNHDLHDRVVPIFFPSGESSVLTRRQLERKADSAANHILRVISTKRSSERSGSETVVALARA